MRVLIFIICLVFSSSLLAKGASSSVPDKVRAIEDYNETIGDPTGVTKIVHVTWDGVSRRGFSKKLAGKTPQAAQRVTDAPAQSTDDTDQTNGRDVNK